MAKFISQFDGQAIDAMIANGASPKGTYASLAALAAAIPAGNSSLYVTLDNGYWNYWNGTAWAAGAAYTDTAAIGNKVDKTVTVNGHALDANVVVTAGDVGLGNCNNTADAAKPVSTAQQAALDLRAEKANTYTKAEVDNKVSSVYRYKGSVATYANLPTDNLVTGDTYNVTDTGINYAWTGTAWDDIGGVEALATASNNGLMSKEDFAKLAAITVANLLTKASVINDLTTGGTQAPASAEMAKTLKGLADANSASISELGTQTEKVVSLTFTENSYWNSNGTVSAISNTAFGTCSIPVIKNERYLISGASVNSAVLYVILGEHGNVSSYYPTTPPASGTAYSNVIINITENGTLKIGQYSAVLQTSLKRLSALDLSETVNKEFFKQLSVSALCVGDSLTQGAYYGAGYTGASIEECYPFYLEKMSGWDVANAGVSGASTIDWYTNQSSNYKYSKYDTFVICLGTNGGLTDTLAADVDPYTGYTNYANTNTGCYCKIIEKIIAGNANAKIFLTNLYVTTGDLTVTNSVIGKIATKYSLTVIDIAKLYPNSTYHPNSNIHFGKVGNVHLAKTVYDGIVKYISEHESSYETLLHPIYPYGTLLKSYIHASNKEVACSDCAPTTGVFTSVAHGLSNGETVYPILNTTAGTAYFTNVVPTGLTMRDSPGYYVVNVTADTFQLSATSGGAALTFTANANMDLTKWHFEIATGVVTISGLPSLMKCRVVIKGKLLRNNDPLYFLPNNYDFSLETWLGSAGTYGRQYITGAGGVFTQAQYTYDCDGAMSVAIEMSGIKPSTATANATPVNNKMVLHNPSLIDTPITLFVASYTTIANGTKIEIYSA